MFKNMIDAARTALRLTITDYDDEVCRLIDAAVADLKQAGIPAPAPWAGADTDVPDGQVSVDIAAVKAAFPATTLETILYKGDAWTLDGHPVNLEDIGVTFTGTPTAGRVILLSSAYSVRDAEVTQAIMTYCRLYFGTPDDYANLERAYAFQKAQLQCESGHGLPDTGAGA